jgi:uncharacterized repeat protein (TIGR03803 family)
VRQLETRLTPSLTTLASFFSPPHGVPQPGLVRDGSGNLYGVSEYGGAHDHGAVFELAHDTGAMTTLASFSDADGEFPSAGLILDGGGNLYGTTTQGGASGDGTVFELAHGSGTVTTLASLNGSDGSDPQFALIMDPAGNLFGTTAGGGASGAGTVFELTKGSGTITTFASFSSTTGSGPYGALTVDGGGNLFGATYAGGASGDGTLFEVVRGSNTITTLASFNGRDGTGPQGSLLLDGSSNLYGTTFVGGAANVGTVFELAAGSGTVTTLASLSTAGGYHPVGGLALDGGGNLYGTTESGGASGDGTVFEVAAGSGTVTTLASFNGANGAYSDGTLVMDSGGNLYGTTPQQGPLGHGTVFELARGSNAVITLDSFDGTIGGGSSGLTMDGHGNLYGVTGGGADGYGAVFELVRSTGSITTLASFNATDGYGSQGTLVLDSHGNLYGTMTGGGPASRGAVFELYRRHDTVITLASFNGANGVYSNGEFPNGTLIRDSSGNLYGTTNEGGAFNDGTVFEVALDSGLVTTLASFNGANGMFPFAGLVADGNGDVFGTTAYGGSGLGTIFELPAAVAPMDQWTGANFAVDTNWSDGANWSTGAPPTAGETAFFINNATVKSFTSTVDAGFACTVRGVDIRGSWGGTITVDSALSVTGNFMLGSGTFGGSGAVTIGGGVSLWYGGRIDVGSGGFTNTGRLQLAAGGGSLGLNGAGTLTNEGTIAQTGAVVLENGATLTNAGRGTYLIRSGSITESGGGTLVNAGTLVCVNSGTIATTTLDNTGTVEVVHGTLDISATVTQVSGSTLRGGTWTVIGNRLNSPTLDITSAGNLTTLGGTANVMLDGVRATFSNLSNLATIAHGGTLSLKDRSFITAGAFTNRGGLNLGPGSDLYLNGSFVQTASGTLTVGMGGSDQVPTYGWLYAFAGTVTLGGSLQVAVTHVPAVGDKFTIVVSGGTSPVGGQFVGLPEGSRFKVTKSTTTMVFRISYVAAGGGGDNNVVLKRVA